MTATPLWPPTALTRTRRAPRPDEEHADRPPSVLHRGLSLLALLALFQGTAGALRSQALGTRALLVLLILLYGAMLLLAVLTFVVRRQRSLCRVDVGVLVLAVLRLAEFFAATTGRHTAVYQDDEGSLVTLAAQAFAAHGHTYGVHWPHFAQQFQVGTTPLMNGGFADSFGYPPLSVLLAAPFVLWLPSWVPVAGMISTSAVVLTALLMFRVLPAPLRPAATLICFGLNYFFFYARSGYPILITLPLLVVAMTQWTGMGQGRLGRRGVVSAVCLGLAASAHQLAWFVVPFLLAGILLARRGELSWPAALRVTGRYAGIAAGAFLLVNLPFAVADGWEWLSGLFSVLTQHAAPQGLGPVDISFYLTSGSGNLGMFSTGALALLLGVFAGFLLFPRRLAPALAVLPWPAFYLATRSTETYLVLLTPLWLVAFATCGGDEFARLWQWRPRLLRDRRVRLSLPALLVLPAAVCLLLALFTPVPLGLRVTSLTPGAPSAGIATVQEIRVTLRNTSGHPLTPVFGTSNDAWLSVGWKVSSGPHTLAPGQSAGYDLRRRGPAMTVSTKGHTYLRVLSDNPQTLTSVALPIAGATASGAQPAAGSAP